MPDPAPLSQPKFYVKPGVKLDGLAPGGARILAVAAEAPLHLGFDVWVTCGLEGHGPADPHTLGKALDFRTEDLTPSQAVQLYEYFRERLGTDLFTTLFECPVPERLQLAPELKAILYQGKSSPTGQHHHVQVKKGGTFPSTVQV